MSIIGQAVEAVRERLGGAGIAGLQRALEECEAKEAEARAAAANKDSATAWRALADAEENTKRTRIRLETLVGAERVSREREEQKRIEGLRAKRSAAEALVTPEAVEAAFAADRAAVRAQILALADAVVRLEERAAAFNEQIVAVRTLDQEIDGRPRDLGKFDRAQGAARGSVEQALTEARDERVKAPGRGHLWHRTVVKISEAVRERHQ